MPKDSRPRRLLALATDSWPARGYLGVCAASLGAAFVFPDSLFASAHLLLTAPLSTMTIALPFGPGTEGGGPAQALALSFSAGWLLLSALVYAAAVGTLSHHIRDSRAARHA
ncbi:SCO4225 family membrane protein [Streptomyces sp. NPDC002776]